MNLSQEKIEKVLPLVTKPGRYIDHELNIVRKDPAAVDVKLVLAYPDVYEIGQSYIGFHILYHLINRRTDALAERAYAPWGDFERVIRAHRIPLFSLESRIPLREFDVIGFTLQYELTYTNILNMLDLAGIPLFAKDREEGVPLILAGGPGALNPEPLADFVDAFVVGDGEEVLVEIIEALKACRKRGANRLEILGRLAQIQGIYVPSFYAPQYDSEGNFSGISPEVDSVPSVVEARYVAELRAEDYPSRPVVPLIETIHDRLSVEVMRGCTRGCRFCQAGMAHRPLRERDPDDIIRQVSSGIAASGWEEVSLVSLSTSDYSGLDAVVSALTPMLREKQVALSLPSMRPETFSTDLARALKDIRKTGLTFAPEAGTQRLREVINKNSTDEEILETVQIAYSHGWNLAKFYFMIGLPTESSEDLDSMADLIGRAVRIGKKIGGGKWLNVAISPFSPKPHTPFQWEAQDDVAILREKIGYLRSRIPYRRVRLKFRDPEVSFLEAVFARGDRRLSGPLLEAWKLGARFDEWTECFDPSVWEEAFRRASLDPRSFVGAYAFERPLPWDPIRVGASKSFLWEERERALRGEVTEDCRLGTCRICGVPNCPTPSHVVSKRDRPRAEEVQPFDEDTHFGRKKRRETSTSVPRAGTLIRVAYSKTGLSRFLSHLDLVRVFDRALRRAQIPVAYSQGFHPHPKLAFGPSLPLGVEGKREYFDIQLSTLYPGNLEVALGRVLPEGLRVLCTKPILAKTESLSAALNLAEYRVEVPPERDLKEKIADLLRAERLVVQRHRKGTSQEVNIRPAILDLRQIKSGGNSSILLSIRIAGKATARISEVLQLLLDVRHKEIPALHVIRTGLFVERDGEKLSPMEVI